MASSSIYAYICIFFIIFFSKLHAVCVYLLFTNAAGSIHHGLLNGSCYRSIVFCYSFFPSPSLSPRNIFNSLLFTCFAGWCTLATVPERFQVHTALTGTAIIISKVQYLSVRNFHENPITILTANLFHNSVE